MITKEASVSLRRSAKKAAVEATRSSLKLCEALYKIYYETCELAGEEVALVRIWGFSDFHSYVERELGIHGMTAMGYVRAYDVIALKMVTKKEVEGIGITKMKQLARILKNVGADEHKKWVKMANLQTCCDFQAAVDAHITGRPAHKAIAFYMSDTSAETLYRNLNTAKMMFGITTYGEVLSKVVAEWTAIAKKARKVRKAA